MYADEYIDHGAGPANESVPLRGFNFNGFNLKTKNKERTR